MRLHEFIRTNREQILIEWEEFARTCAPASDTMDVDALRDHASEMLTVIAADLESHQGEVDPSEKSEEDAADSGESELTAAEEHGEERAESGFSTPQIVAEYRSLRNSVLRLWTQERKELNPADILDLIRFNETIDQMLAESVAEYTETVEDAKEMFLAILGHDLRNPLGAILTSATFLNQTGEMDRTLTVQIVESAKRATQMVGDLLDFTRGRLGGGIPINRGECDLTMIVKDVVDELVAAHTEGNVQVESGGPQIGRWDASRLSQALANLVGNAVEHGDPDFPVIVELDGGEKDVAITIHNRNRGGPISAEQLDGIFNPMKLSTTSQEASAHGPTANLGLGIYIAERIVHAHEGRIEVESSEAHGTTFTIHLPRGE